MSLISVNNLTFGYDGSLKNIFENVSFNIDTDWKLGLIGRNGKGKTTFLKLLLGKYEYQGAISKNVEFDYFPFEVKNKERMAIEIVNEIAPNVEDWEIIRELNLLNTDTEVLYRSFNLLSGGEQIKILLISLFLKGNNFLLIDEPTNHLDIETRNNLVNYLEKKKGFILVSHDRNFLDKVVNHIISINNTNIENISLDNIYGNIALVSTNSYIFNGTILDNLLMAKRDASEEEINEALKTARLYDFVKELKDGLLTDVGQAGSALSGGQKQRLALARVILADRSMIIFDEATSNIDVESEESIWEAIYELSKNKTILVISHRLANVKDAKKIYVMNKGHLVEGGAHDELMSKEKYYYDMVNKQNELEMIREVC